MTKITITLDNKLKRDLSNISEVNDEINAVKAAFDDSYFFEVTSDDEDRIVLTGDLPGTHTYPQSLPDPAPAPITRVVQVRGQYTYLLYVDDHGEVRVGGSVDIEAKNGGHWNGKVTRVWPTVEDYIESEGGEAPSLYIIGVIDPGPRY